jgi:hypothetical protein
MLVGEGDVLVILMPRKKVLKRRIGLHPSEKELAEWRSSVFCHKNTPGAGIIPVYLSNQL